jgi:hypothetical protein
METIQEEVTLKSGRYAAGRFAASPLQVRAAHAALKGLGRVGLALIRPAAQGPPLNPRRTARGLRPSEAKGVVQPRSGEPAHRFTSSSA